jgi:hypothetical protein
MSTSGKAGQFGESDDSSLRSPVATTPVFHHNAMEEEANVECVYCGASTTLLCDTSLPRQEFTVDCENCCRPLAVRIEAEDGVILSLDVLNG